MGVRKDSGLLMVIILVPVTALVIGLLSSVRDVTSQGKSKVVIDTDPGADDAMAILMMLSGISNADVLAITTSSGNTGVRNATRNAKLVLQVANRSSDIPVYSGSEHGLVFTAETDQFFGYDGLGDVFTSDYVNTTVSSLQAGTVLAELVRENPDDITVLVIGPLTNIALALHLNPDFLKQVKDIVILGGSYRGGGNKKPGVEFNIYSDPEAAALVFSRASPDKPLTVIPLETVFAANFTKEWRLTVLGSINTCSMEFLNKAELVSLSKASAEWYPFDQMAASVILEPTLITSTELVFIRVETCGPLGRGAFFRDDKSTTKNTRLVTGVDKTLLGNVIVDYIKSSPGICL